MLREILTKISGFSDAVQKISDKNDFIATIIVIVGFPIYFFGPILVAFFILKTLFPYFYTFGDDQTVHSLAFLLSLPLYGALYWLLFSGPKDYVAEKIAKDMDKTILQLNSLMRENTQPSLPFKITELKKSGSQRFNLKIKSNDIENYEKYRAWFKKTEKNLDKLNELIQKYNDRGSECKIKLDKFDEAKYRNNKNAPLYLFSRVVKLKSFVRQYNN